MLDILRRSSKSLAGLLVIAMAILLMASFGLDYYYSAPRREAALTINGEEIPFERYRLAEEKMLRLFGDAQMARRFAEDSLISDVLFTEFSETLGLSASLRQVQEKILENPYFSGEYTPEKFRTFLQVSGMTAVQLERFMTHEIIREQLQRMTRDLSWFSDVELRSLYNNERTTYDVRYIRLHAGDFLEKVAVDESKLREFFEDDPEPYRRPREVRYTFVKFTPLEVEAKVQITDEDLEELYEDGSLPGLTEPKQVSLKKIAFEKVKTGTPLQELVPTAPDEAQDGSNQSSGNSNEARRAMAEAVVKRLKDGEEFDRIVAEVTGNPTRGAKAETLGFVEPKVLGPALEKAADQLELGDVTSVIDTPDSYVVLYAADLRPERKKPLEEVRGALEEHIRKDRAPEYARLQAEDFLAKWIEGANRRKHLTEFAAEQGLQVGTSGGLRDVHSDPEGASGLSALVSGMELGDQNLVEIGDDTYVVQVDEVRESFIPPFEEVRRTVEERYRWELARDLARVFGRELVEEASAAGHGERVGERSLAEIGAKHGLTVQTISSVSRGSATGELFFSQEVRNRVFALTPERAVSSELFESGDQFFVVELAKRVAPDPEKFPEERNALLERERERAGRRIFAALQARLRDDAEIVRNLSLGESSY